MAETTGSEAGMAGRDQGLPRHVAIIMDGNGRWAQQRGLPRFAGHKAGVEAVRGVVERCVTLGIEVLTLFAFSSENWRRPPKEVSLLMELFMMALKREVRRLKRNDVRLRIIGDRSAFPPKLQRRIIEAEAVTADCDGVTLQVAANYGGRWDLAQAAARLAQRVQEGRLAPADIDENALTAELSTAGQPEPDLFIRTGGEQRLSNFLLWQCAYTELYFTDLYWPEFDSAAFDQALDSYRQRNRRFGRTTEQALSEQGS